MHIISKQGSADNVLTYEHICDTAADMAKIERKYITLGSVCIVLQGESGAMEVYMADSGKEWHDIMIAGSGSSSDAAGLSLYVCTSMEVLNGKPNVSIPLERTLYLVPSGNESGNLYDEYIYVNNAWELFGSAGVDLTGYATESWVQQQNYLTTHQDISGKANSADLALKADKTDTVLETTLSRGRKDNTTAGGASLAFGIDTEASGYYSVALGLNTTASSQGAFAEGKNTVAHYIAHAEGEDTQALGQWAHSQGVGTVAKGAASFASGDNTIANGHSSFVTGRYNAADSYDNWEFWAANTSYVVGDKVKRQQLVNNEPTIIGYICKEVNTDATFDISHWDFDSNHMNYSVIVGNGYEAEDPETHQTVRHGSNAYALDWDGNEYIAGDVYVHSNADSTGGIKLAKITDIPDTSIYATKANTVLESTLSRGRKEGTTVGEGSFAFGNNVEASGAYTFATGVASIASGPRSHAEGSGTIASAANAHAEGAGTTASGVHSHAEGKGTVASSTVQHVQGVYNVVDANTIYASIVGNGETDNTRSNAYALDWDGNGHFAGDVYVGANPNSTGGEKLAKESDILIESGTGIGSIQSKQFTMTIDDEDNIFVQSASGEGAVAFGANTSASSFAATAIGIYTTASGECSFAEGDGSKAIGYASHAEGSQETQAIGDSSHAEGTSSYALGEGTHSEGNFTRAIGIHSHSEGHETVALGDQSHAEGYGETCRGAISSHPSANVYGVLLSADVCKGCTVRLLTEDGIPDDQTYTIVSVDYANDQITLNADPFDIDDIILIENNVAIGDASHTEGSFTIATSDSSHSEGDHTIAKGEAQHVQGKYNIEDTSETYAHIVGNGTTNSNRSNAHTLDWNGNAWYAGKVTAGTVNSPANPTAANDLTTKQYVDNALAAKVVSVGGTTPVITAVADTQYICGEVSTLSFTPSATGTCDVIFESGAIATVLTVPSTVKFPEWFDASALDVNMTYEINITNGIYGAVMSWVTT